MSSYKESSILAFIKKIKKGQTGGGNVIGNGLTLLKEKAGFLSSVFGTLAVQLIVVALVAYYLSQRSGTLTVVKQWFLLYALATFIIIIVLALVPMHPLLKFGLFTLFSVLTGFLVAIATSRVSKEVILAAVQGTLAIFIAFIILGVLIAASGIDITWLGLVLFFALLVLIIVRIVYIVIKDPSKKLQRIFAIVGLIIFSLYIMYDTFNILQRDYFGDFVTAALDYFLDIINIFLNTMSFMQNS